METTEKENQNITYFKIGQSPPRSSHSNKITTKKYTFLTFVPFNFFDQLKKGPTLVFFITLILLCIPSISPFEPYSYFIAFCIVVGISMIKEAIEDYKRNEADNLVNNTIIKILEFDRDHIFIKEIYCMDLMRGDYILLERNVEVQADVVLLNAKCYSRNKLECTKYCYIDTSSIDGENNLKKKNAIPFEQDQPCTLGPTRNVHHLCTCTWCFNGKINSFSLKDTGDSFNDFECDIDFNGKLIIATEKNAILRGSIIKNTEIALALVVGVGDETKQSKCELKVRKVKTLLDDRMDYFLKLIVILYVIIMITTLIVGAWFLYSNSGASYLNIDSNSLYLIKLMFSNYIIYMYLIPLSLYVTLEVVRMIHLLYIDNDKNMIHDGKASICRNPNLIADLGLINYILTDKTGTITENQMTLKRFHLWGNDSLSKPTHLCEIIKDIIMKFNLMKSTSTDVKLVPESHPYEFKKNIYEFFRYINREKDFRSKFLLLMGLLVCNSVEIIKGKFEGVSQEEICFLELLKSEGFVLKERHAKFVVVELETLTFQVKIIGTLEFSSKRRRMSVLCKIFGKFYILTKGSDQVCLNKQYDSDVLKIINQPNDYRCLVFKAKEVSPQDIKYYLNTMKIAISNTSINLETSNVLEDQREREEALFSQLEKNSSYVGSAFIEDELQENVQETMKSLLLAGIKIWMITGDKQETAEACGRNSGIIVDDDYMAMDGQEMIRLIESQDDRVLYEKKSVIVYRANPSHKGRIATAISAKKKGILSIGDGNNDIAMLNNSDVGVGIMGKEGNQASLAADFAIPKFKFLKPLILIHGRYSFHRYTKLVMNSYYKNIVFILGQFLYNFFNGASGRSLYNSFILNYFNLFFTSLIPFTTALFDKDIPNSHALSHPNKYKNIRKLFNNSFINSIMIYAIMQAFLYFACIKFLLWNDIIGSSGLVGGHSCVSTIFSIIMISAVLLRQVKMVSFNTFYNSISLWLTILINVLAMFFIQELYNKYNHAIYHLLEMPSFYLILICCGSLLYVVDVLYELWESILYERCNEKY